MKSSHQKLLAENRAAFDLIERIIDTMPETGPVVSYLSGSNGGAIYYYGPLKPCEMSIIALVYGSEDWTSTPAGGDSVDYSKTLPNGVEVKISNAARRKKDSSTLSREELLGGMS